VSDFPREGRLAGIDYGTVRIGIAISDARRTLASPLVNYTRRDLAADQRFFQQLVVDEAICGLVVGLPIHISGRESQKSREARQFGQWLTEVTGLPVRFYDERYTTREATWLLEDAQLTKKKRRKRLDMVAAQQILAGYLESLQQEQPPAPLDD